MILDSGKFWARVGDLRVVDNEVMEDWLYIEPYRGTGGGWKVEWFSPQITEEQRGARGVICFRPE